MSVYRQNGKETFTYDFTVEGRRLRGSTGATTKRAAEAVEARLRAAEVARIGEDGRKRHTLDEACGRYLLEHAAGLASEAVVTYQLQHVLDGVGKDTLLDELTAEKIADFVSWRRAQTVGKKNPKRVGPATVNREITTLRAVLNMAADRWGWRVAKVDFASQFLREPAARERYLTADEARALIGEAAKHLKAPIEFSLLTGIRLSNCMRLDWSQIDLDGREIRLRVKSKHPGGRPLQVPLSAPCVALLASIGPKAAGAVFTRDGDEIKTWRTAFAAACRRAGIADFRWHDLRHTAASWMVQARVPLDVVRQILGHAEISTTMRYAHREKSARQAAVDAIAPLLRHPDKPKRSKLRVVKG